MNIENWPWKPNPDYTRLTGYLKGNGKTNFVPLLEFLIDPEIIRTLSTELFPDTPSHGTTELEKSLDRTMWVYYRLGYDALRAKPILDLPFKKINTDDTAV